MAASAGTLAKIDTWRSFSSPPVFLGHAFNNRDGRPEENLMYNSSYSGGASVARGNKLVARAKRCPISVPRKNGNTIKLSGSPGSHPG